MIEARRAVKSFEGPLAYQGGKVPATRDPVEEALWQRITTGSGLASRLTIVTHPRHARHPLLDEGIRLRAQLTTIANEALSQRKEREVQSREAQRRYFALLMEQDRAKARRQG